MGTRLSGKGRQGLAAGGVLLLTALAWGQGEPSFTVPVRPASPVPEFPVPLRPGASAADSRTLLFVRPLTADVEGPGGQPLGRLLVQEGARLRARVRWPERVDLVLEDGTVLRGVPLSSFASPEDGPGR